MAKRLELLEFFTTNNSSGWKTKEKILREKEPDIYLNIINHAKDLQFSNELKFTEKIWYFINDEIEQILCPVCGTPIKFGRSIKEGYNKYCSIKCANQSTEHKKNVKQTNLKRYGGNTPFNSQTIVEKAKKTNLERYGVDNIMKLPETLTKLKNGAIEKWGVPYYFQSKEHTKRSLDKYTDIGLVDVNKKVYTIHCDKCNKNVDIDINLFYYRKRNNITLCTHCVPETIFVKQNEILNWLKELLPNEKILVNDRKVLKPKEIDIYLPDHKMGIEFNGLYWHSSLFKDNYYHQSKQETCEIKEIKLFQIFEDEWDLNPEIVKSMIKNMLRLNNIKIYARKTIVKEITTPEASKFLNENHLQGYSKSQIKTGLFYKDKLVSVMTFSKPRIISGRRETAPDIYEMIRFASIKNTNVIGGAGKLLSYFVKKYKVKKILTYADRRFSSGNVYKKLDFEFIRYTKPNYFYLLKNKRIHRFTLNKQRLVSMGFDKNKTADRIMKENNIFKIYDCGSLLFEKIFSQ